MDILYQNKFLILRTARLQDCEALAAVLRPEDRAELAASHPGQSPAELLKKFFISSRHCFVLEYQSEPTAVFGLAPEVWLGRYACVWLLTGRGVLHIPKTFLRLTRRLLADAFSQYEELYNFVDERYAAALRFVQRLGGRFDGRFYRTPSARFLCFTFRRK